MFSIAHRFYAIARSFASLRMIKGDFFSGFRVRDWYNYGNIILLPELAGQGGGQR
jgi:hypothetical protein